VMRRRHGGAAAAGHRRRRRSKWSAPPESSRRDVQPSLLRLLLNRSLRGPKRRSKIAVLGFSRSRSRHFRPSPVTPDFSGASPGSRGVLRPAPPLSSPPMTAAAQYQAAWAVSAGDGVPDNMGVGVAFTRHVGNRKAAAITPAAAVYRVRVSGWFSGEYG
jgi:hypothetical protein